MTDIDNKLKNFRKELINQEDKDAAFTQWFRERVVVWPIILLVVILTIMWGVGSAEAQERPFDGPVNQGEWVVPPQGVIVCNADVPPGYADPDKCIWVNDHWGPYPTNEICMARMQQMANELPVLRLQETGIPQWGGHVRSCVKKEPEGVDV